MLALMCAIEKYCVRRHKDLSTAELGIEGEAGKIYVNEHLTSKNKHLLRLFRDFCRKAGFKYLSVIVEN